jgi:cytochrome c biogenesis protein ResB
METPVTLLEDTAAAEPPRPRRERGALARTYALLTSPRLAIALLIAILACCVVGVTLVRGERAWRLIFSTLWFNALLVLLALSSAAAFFTRVWRRKLSVVQVGMIVFHVSFATLLGGVVYNSLFHFDGMLRLTEGETLVNAAPESYDAFEKGRLFDMRRLPGETTLLRMHSKYVVDGQNKRVAYDVAVGEGAGKTTGTVYMTRALEHDGVRYFCSTEGYSVLVVMTDREGREVYGAHVPLQSIAQEDGSHVYATGSKSEPLSFPFPFPPEKPLTELIVTFRPSTVSERQGEVGFHLSPLQASDTADAWTAGAAKAASRRAGQVPVGGEFDAGDFKLTPREVRYWVAMNVRHDPGQNVILGSMCFGLAGMAITLYGRVRQRSPRRAAAS